ncbi:TetR/AcrR family transcriptional regulator [Humidisolicoccus flavus]|uniref:TetR/AcrR family transcriptional regulator n=1 Tax=Humidisolicoccus flavus TaxID=3111414 RepID=UPI0032457045
MEGAEQAAGSRQQQSRLQCAEACSALYIERGTTDLTIAEIAASVGVSERTFYRYFPIKAESVSPIFDWTTAAFNAAVAAAPPEASARDALLAAFRAGISGAKLARSRALFPLVFADEQMWSVFLRKVHDGERTLAPVLAPRLHEPADSIASRIAAAAVASATRIALENMVVDGDDPESRFIELLDGFGAGVFPPHPA